MSVLFVRHVPQNVDALPGDTGETVTVKEDHEDALMDSVRSVWSIA